MGNSSDTDLVSLVTRQTAEREDPSKANSPDEANLRRNSADRILKFKDIDKISFCFFLTESWSFTISYLMDRIPIFIAYVMYSFINETQHTNAIGFFLTYVMTLLALSSDFQEPIGIVLGPLYSKKKYYAYKVDSFRLLFTNLLFFVLNLPVCFLYEWLYRILKLDEKFIPLYTEYSIATTLIVIPLLMTANFLKGFFVGFRGIYIEYSRLSIFTEFFKVLIVKDVFLNYETGFGII